MATLAQSVQAESSSNVGSAGPVSKSSIWSSATVYDDEVALLKQEIKANVGRVESYLRSKSTLHRALNIVYVSGVCGIGAIGIYNVPVPLCDRLKRDLAPVLADYTPKIEALVRQYSDVYKEANVGELATGTVLCGPGRCLIVPRSDALKRVQIASGGKTFELS